VTAAHGLRTLRVVSPPDPKNRSARRGLLILAGLVAAAVLIFYIDVVVDLFRPRVEIVALVPSAPGVRAGSAVWVAGVEAGRVTSVQLARRGDSALVALDLRLEGRTRRILRRDSDVYTGSRRFIGEPIVHLTAGSTAAAQVDDGDTIRARPRVDPREMLARARTFPRALDSLFDAADRAGSLVEGRQEALGDLLDRTAVASREAGALSRDLERGSLGRLLDDRRMGDRIDAVRLRVQQLGRAADDAAERYTGPDSELPERLGRLNLRAGRLASQLDSLQQRSAAAGGFLHRSSRDSAIAVAVSGVRAQIDSLMAEAESIALRMILP